MMKKITPFILSILFTILMTDTTNAQVEYTYTLVDNGNYSYSVSAVPEASTSNFQTSVQSYGFVIFLPAGVTINVTSSFGGNAGETNFNTNALPDGDPAIDGYQITETLGSPINLPAPSGGAATPMVTFEVQGMPTTGILEIMANDSAFANSNSFLKNFLTADTQDDGSATFENTIPQDVSGLSGTTSSDFSTLSSEDFRLNTISIFPNPIVDTFNIKTAGITIDAAQIYSINGTLVKTINTNTIENAINIQDLNSGIYFLQLTSGNSKSTIKLLKQ